MRDEIKNMWWNTATDDEMKRANPHLIHLIGKSIEELHIMFPDAKICKNPDCDFNLLDHAISMEYDQQTHDTSKGDKK